MSTTFSAAQVIVALAGSSTVGGLFTLLVTPLVNRRRNKLDEADIMSRISSELREELQEIRDEQADTINRLREVLINLTGLLDEVLPRLSGITAEELTRLRVANIEARLTGLAVSHSDRIRRSQ